jgi:hypothetical protein
MNTKFKEFKKKLFNKKIRKQALFSHLKKEHSFEEQLYILSKLPKTFESLVYGVPIFKSTKNFGLKELTPFVTEKSEMNWLTHLFKKYSEELNTFLIHKTEFETRLLLGDYKKSKEALN